MHSSVDTYFNDIYKCAKAANTLGILCLQIKFKSQMSATEFQSYSFPIESVVKSKTEKEKYELPKQNIRVLIFAKLYNNDVGSEIFYRRTRIQVNQAQQLKKETQSFGKEIMQFYKKEEKLRKDIMDCQNERLQQKYLLMYDEIIDSIRRMKAKLQEKEQQLKEIENRRKKP